MFGIDGRRAENILVMYPPNEHKVNGMLSRAKTIDIYSNSVTSFCMIFCRGLR